MAHPQISKPWPSAIKDVMGGICVFHTSAAAAAVGAAVGVGPQVSGGGGAERGLVQRQCFQPRLPQVGGVFFSPHPEIGEVMKHGAETVLAILTVLLGIQDVEMPEVVHQAGGHNRILGVLKAQNQETAILPGHPTGKVQRPAVAFFSVHGLDEDGLQVQVRQDPLPSVPQAGRAPEGCRGPDPAQLPVDPAEKPAPEALFHNAGRPNELGG